MVAWSDITSWTGTGLDTVLDDLIAERKDAVESRDNIASIDVSTGWEGAGATAAQERLTQLKDVCIKHLCLLGDLITATSTAQTGMGDVETLVLEAQTIADNYGFTISDDGTVTDPNPVKIQWYEKFSHSYGDLNMSHLDSNDTKQQEKIDRETRLKECSDTVTSAFNKATEVDNDYKTSLDNVANGQATEIEDFNDSTPGLSNLPPENASTEQVAAWWNSLTSSEKGEMVNSHYDKIGNLDGIEAWARDRANRKRLDEDIQTCTDDNMKYNNIVSKYIQDKKNGKELSQEEEDELNFATHESLVTDKRLKELEAIKNSLNRSNDTQLLLYDPATGENGHELTHAAISIGNVDTADHVATYVPGMTTNVTDSMEDITNDMFNMQDEAKATSGVGSVATIGWIGYDCPPLPIDGHNFGDFSVGGTGEAEMGGQSLARFTEGIQDSRNANNPGVSPVHQSVIAHSYGSTTASYGVEQVRPGVVDDFCVFGSPGVKNGGFDMNVPEGHNYALGFSNDFVKGAYLGRNPYEDPEFKQLDPDDIDTKKTGHSGYLVDKSRAQHEIAKVIVGKGDK